MHEFQWPRDTRQEGVARKVLHLAYFESAKVDLEIFNAPNDSSPFENLQLRGVYSLSVKQNMTLHDMYAVKEVKHRYCWRLKANLWSLIIFPIMVDIQP